MAGSIFQLTTEGDLKKWDKFVQDHPHGAFTQLRAWAKVKESFGWKTQVWVAMDGERIMAGAQVFIRQLPLGQQLWYVPYGPLWLESHEEVGRQMVTELQKLAAGALVLKIEPRYQQDGAGGDLKEFLRSHRFGPVTHSQQPQDTFILDLSKNEDELMADMRQTTRRYIRQAQRAGLVAEKVDANEQIDDFYQMLQKVDARKKFGIHTKEYYQTVAEAFGGQAHLFIVRRERELLGAYFLVHLGDKSWELYGGVTDEGQQCKANYLLKWKSILEMQAIGVKVYDQWGVAPVLASGEVDRAHPLAGVTYFKEGFGGQRVQWLGGWDFASKPWLYKLAQLSGKL